MPKNTIIGYWNNEKNSYPEFPMPHQGVKRDVSEDLQKLQLIIDSVFTRTVYCKGSSTCRLCGSTNGSAEHIVSLRKKGKIFHQITIPSGYQHYLEKHFIPLDPNIIEIHEYISSLK